LGEKQVPKPNWELWNQKANLGTQWRTTPYAIDWKQSMPMDLVMLDHEGYLAFLSDLKSGASFI